MPVRVAIQGELGSNSHMAALAMLGDTEKSEVEIAACATSAEVFERVASGLVDGAVLPIENCMDRLRNTTICCWHSRSASLGKVCCE